MISTLGNRVGRFSINSNMIQSEPDLVLALLQHIIVVRAEIMYGGRVEYIGLSKYFDVADPCEMAPAYSALITIVQPPTTDPEAPGEWRIEWRRMDA